MNSFYAFETGIDREKIFKRMNLHRDSAHYHYYVKSYGELLEELKYLVKLEGFYELKPNTLGKIFHSDLEVPTHVVFCLITLGEAISQRSTELFNENDPFKGLLLDAMANQLLFDSSEMFYRHIREDIHENKGFGLTRRYSPGDEGICLSFQKDILNNLNETMNQTIEITQKYMYKPSKTLGYIYGADQSFECSSKDHDCSNCDHTACSFRKRIN